MKKVLIGIGVVVVLIIGGVVYLATNLESLIETAIEEHGSKAAGAPVRVGGVDIDPGKGAATIYGLSLGNPPGFEADSAFEMRRISVTLDPASLAADTIIINEILAVGPKVTYELGADGSNFDALKANLEAAAGASPTEAEAKTEPEPADDTAEQKTGTTVIIENFRLRDGEIAATASLLGGKTLSLPLPDLHLTDIGKDDGGASPAEAAEKILAALENSVSGAMTGVDLGAIGDTVKAVGEKVGEQAGEIVESLGEGAGGAVDSIGEAAGGVGEGLGEGLDSAGDAVKGLFD